MVTEMSIINRYAAIIFITGFGRLRPADNAIRCSPRGVSGRSITSHDGNLTSDDLDAVIVSKLTFLSDSCLTLSSSNAARRY